METRGKRVRNLHLAEFKTRWLRWEEKIHSRWYWHAVAKWILPKQIGLLFQEHLKLQATLNDPSSQILKRI